MCQQATPCLRFEIAKEAASVCGLYLSCAYYDGASLVDTRMSMRPGYALASEKSFEPRVSRPPVVHPEIAQLSPSIRTIQHL